LKNAGLEGPIVPFTSNKNNPLLSHDGFLEPDSETESYSGIELQIVSGEPAAREVPPEIDHRVAEIETHDCVTRRVEFDHTTEVERERRTPSGESACERWRENGHARDWFGGLPAAHIAGPDLAEDPSPALTSSPPSIRITTESVAY
jgi:hypothetical protein